MPGPDRILVRLPTWVGDAVMATPALRALRRRFPETEMILMGRASLEPLLAGGNLFDRYLPVASGRGRVGENIARLRTCQADIAILLPHSFRSAWETWWGKIPRRLGYARELRGALLTDALIPHRSGGKIVPVPMHHQYLELVAILGAAGDGVGPLLAIDEGVEARGLERLAAIGVSGEGRWIGIHPGASFGPSKVYPLPRLAEVARRLRAEEEVGIVITCGPGEEDLAAELENLIGGEVVSLSENLWPLDEFKVLVRHLDLLVTGDTGPRHIAAGLGVPQLVLMGPTDPRYSAAFLEKTVVVRKDVPCGPCQLKVCPLDHRCMTEISPEEVISASKQLLATVTGA
ncbi:MAG TPA: lipopolysaccharide heptosyltransferase II [Planctomycetes bacterium]|nr:lipopolysaccharide heptosyltransferase II [Planctomycetota bacterium]HIN79609.1 lipopolysaccharide heptosyltransferase II [Planctomycetota bacterium]